MPSKIPTAMPVGLGMASYQTQAVSAVGSAYRSNLGNVVSMAGVSPVTQGDDLQDFSRDLDKALAVHPRMIEMRSWLESCDLEGPTLVSNPRCKTMHGWQV